MGNISSKSCTLTPVKEQFEREFKASESALLTFDGVNGKDVYNCSIPFTFKGKTYMFGRVEENTDWVFSDVYMFERVGENTFARHMESKTWNLEDPFISKIHGEMLMGGTHVTKNRGELQGLCCEFYRGQPDNLKYFTSGPERMKDIRLVELANGKIGMFTHNRTDGSCFTGFVTFDSLDELSVELINSAKLINHRAFGNAWGGPNQAYLLDSGKIGCISHHGYLQDREQGLQVCVYCITSFVFDPETYDVHDFKVIGTKGCFPPCEPKLPRLADCAFVSGIVMRDDGKCDLYSGLGDTHEGRMVIDYPFEGHGKIARDVDF